MEWLLRCGHLLKLLKGTLSTFLDAGLDVERTSALQGASQFLNTGQPFHRYDWENRWDRRKTFKKGRSIPVKEQSLQQFSGVRRRVPARLIPEYERTFM